MNSTDSENAQKIYTVNISINLKEEDISDIVITALEGGIGYWACLDNTTDVWNEYYEKYPDDATSELAVKILIDGKSIYFDDEEDVGRRYEFTLEKLLHGIAELDTVRFSDALMESLDSEVGDMVFQYGIFDKVIYG
jgi:hypothetical protein